MAGGGLGRKGNKPPVRVLLMPIARSIVIAEWLPGRTRHAVAGLASAALECSSSERTTLA